MVRFSDRVKYFSDISICDRNINLGDKFISWDGVEKISIVDILISRELLHNSLVYISDHESS